jgi:hypothetical protein
VPKSCDGGLGLLDGVLDRAEPVEHLVEALARRPRRPCRSSRPSSGRQAEIFEALLGGRGAVDGADRELLERVGDEVAVARARLQALGDEAGGGLAVDAELAELGAVLVEGVEEVAGFVVAVLEALGDDVQRVLRVLREAGAHELADARVTPPRSWSNALLTLMTSPVMPCRCAPDALPMPSMSVTTLRIAPLTSLRLSP